MLKLQSLNREEGIGVVEVEVIRREEVEANEFGSHDDIEGVGKVGVGEVSSVEWDRAEAGGR